MDAGIKALAVATMANWNFMVVLCMLSYEDELYLDRSMDGGVSTRTSIRASRIHVSSNIYLTEDDEEDTSARMETVKVTIPSRGGARNAEFRLPLSDAAEPTDTAP